MIYRAFTSVCMRKENNNERAGLETPFDSGDLMFEENTEHIMDRHKHE